MGLTTGAKRTGKVNKAGLAKFELVDYNCNNEQLKKYGFFTKDEEPKYEREQFCNAKCVDGNWSLSAKSWKRQADLYQKIVGKELLASEVPPVEDMKAKVQRLQLILRDVDSGQHVRLNSEWFKDESVQDNLYRNSYFYPSMSFKFNVFQERDSKGNPVLIKEEKLTKAPPAPNWGTFLGTTLKFDELMGFLKALSHTLNISDNGVALFQKGSETFEALGGKKFINGDFSVIKTLIKIGKKITENDVTRDRLPEERAIWACYGLNLNNTGNASQTLVPTVFAPIEYVKGDIITPIREFNHARIVQGKYTFFNRGITTVLPIKAVSEITGEVELMISKNPLLPASLKNKKKPVKKDEPLSDDENFNDSNEESVDDMF